DVCSSDLMRQVLKMRSLALLVRSPWLRRFCSKYNQIEALVGHFHEGGRPVVGVLLPGRSLGSGLVGHSPVPGPRPEEGPSEPGECPSEGVGPVDPPELELRSPLMSLRGSPAATPRLLGVQAGLAWSDVD